MGTLRNGRPGERFQIERITVQGQYRRRLLEMGLIPGAAVTIAGVGVFGGRILRIGDARVAVDADTARSIMAERVSVGE